MSLNFSKAEGVRQTADALAQLAEERLSESTVAGVDSSQALDSEIGKFHLEKTRTNQADHQATANPFPTIEKTDICTR